MRERLAETSYVCAFGYAMRTEALTVEQALKEADAAMYADKERLKREVVARGGALHDRHAEPPRQTETGGD
jgi:hypothetical protein